MNAPLATPTAETFSLKRRNDSGGTPAMNYWGCTSEYGVLTDVLLGKADHIKHLSTTSLSRKYLRDRDEVERCLMCSALPSSPSVSTPFSDVQPP